MGDAGFYRGTNSDQDSRFTDKEKKLLKSMKFENKLDIKVDLQRVNIEVIKPWITTRLNELLGVEDEVVVEYVFSLLEDKNLNPKVMQINLTGFLNARRSREFMAELWELLDEAQNTEDGIPPRILEKKMQEMKKTGAMKAEIKTEPDDCDWKNRYTSLTGGRYGGSSSSSRHDDNRRSRGGEDRGRDRRSDDRDRRVEDTRDRDRKRVRHASRSRTPPRRRRRDSRSPQNTRSNRRRSRSSSETREKRRRGEDHKSRHRSASRSPRRRERDGSSDRQHRSDKHKKERKSKSDRDRD